MPPTSASQASASQNSAAQASRSQGRAANRDIRLPGEDLTLTETLRVMDVAREMREQRETAEEVFRRDGARSRLREKLIRTARLSGDRVTDDEIDAAINQYMATVHAYVDPEPGFRKFLAHCWVWRGRIIAGLSTVALAVGSFWWLLA